MSSSLSTKPHAVCIPFPAQGHVTPFMTLGKLLHSRGFHITFVNSEFNHRRLLGSIGPDSVKDIPDFRFETVPDGLPPPDKDATQDLATLCDSIGKTCFLPFKKLFMNLNSQGPPVTCVIADVVMGVASKAAREMGIPEVQFWTASAYAFMGYCHYNELIQRGIVPFKDENYFNDGTLETQIEWIPGMRDIQLKDLPSFMRITDPSDIMLNYMVEETQNSLKSSAIIFNTFRDLEEEVLEAFVKKFNYANIYMIGPLHLLAKHVPQGRVKSLNLSLWNPRSEALQWLDKREAGSVVYVNYGSIAVMSDEHLKEFAWGLANSKHQFLWIIRPDLVNGDSVALPKEFMEEIKEKGLLVSWCEQEEVLANPAIGAFLTHCGWNSTIESICEGVPIICWPFCGDQPTNCRYACAEWGIGMEVYKDVRRDHVEQVVTEMMKGEKGKERRKRAKEWEKIAKEATGVGGSSYLDFDKFINTTLHLEG